MAVPVGINGFGRIGRLALRAMRDLDVEVVGVNDLVDAKTLAHLLQWDSVHGPYPGTVEADGDSLVIDGRKVPVHAEKEPKRLPWKQAGAKVVLESTGAFTQRDAAAGHLEAGAERVIISAPAKEPDATFVLGVNDREYDPAKHRVVSNASCTTNCLAPVVKVLYDTFGVERGLMVTVHAYTADQRIVDAPHKDLRRARAGALNIIPTSTGAARAIGLVMPELEGKLDGYAMRVPTPDVSVVDLTAELRKDADADAINAAMKKAAEGPLKGILRYEEAPLVSSDFIGSRHSSILDAPNTRVLDGHFAKLLAWYDNEMGYATRCGELAVRLGR